MAYTPKNWLNEGESPGSPRTPLSAEAMEELETNLAAYVDSKNVDVVQFGAVGDGVADDAQAFRDAIAALPAAGGTVIVPAPASRYLIGSTISITRNYVSIRSLSRSYACELRRSGDYPIFDSSGTVSVRRYDFTLDGLVLDGGDNVAWTAPLWLCDHNSTPRIGDVEFHNSYGCGVKGDNVWDPWFTETRFYRVGGTDGTKPAIYFTGTGGGTNVTNNLWCVNTRIEPVRDGAIWLDAGHLCRFLNTKIESHGDVRGNLIRAIDPRYIYFNGLELVHDGALAAGVSGPVDLVTVTGGQHADFDHIQASIGSFGAGDVRSLFRFDGGATESLHHSVDHVHIASGSANTPDAVASWTGTNNYVAWGDVTWNSNWQARPTWSGAPTSLASSAPIPILSGVGKVAAVDADFNTKPIDGQTALVLNTTDGAVRHAVRVAGAWKHSAALT